MCTTFRRKKNHDLNVFFESHQLFRLFGLGETRLKSHILSDSLSRPHYSLIRKDATRSQHKGLVVRVKIQSVNLLMLLFGNESLTSLVYINIRHKMAG